MNVRTGKSFKNKIAIEIYRRENPNKTLILGDYKKINKAIECSNKKGFKTSLQMSQPWFDMVKSGEKTEEYREFKKFYHQRLAQFIFGDDLIEITFINGYKKDSRRFTAICTVNYGYGKVKWGAPLNEPVYILNVLKIIREGKNV